MNVHNRHPNLPEISQDFGDISIVLKMAHFRKSTRAHDELIKNMAGVRMFFFFTSNLYYQSNYDV